MATAATGTSRFPLPYAQSVQQWWATSASSPLQIQKAILGITPFFRVPDYRTARQEFVRLSGHNRFLNEVYITENTCSTSSTSSLSVTGNEDIIQSEKTGAKRNVVLLHGYGAGLGFWFRNFEGLTSSLIKTTDFYALDWLGMGLSSRPPFTVTARDPHSKIVQAESFFVDSLEEWRALRGLEKVTLVGHSLGGYLAVRYAIKYPERVDKVVLVSPVGVPKNPYDKDTTAGPTLNTGSPQTTLISEFDDPETEPQKNPLPKWITTLWDLNFSPFFFVRFAGPFGPKLVSGWTGRRFSHLGNEEQELLHSYAYEIFKKRGSGEYSLAYLLAPGAHARSALLRVLPTHVRVLIMYGDRDWMDEGAGRKAAEIANRKGGDVRVVRVEDAGHHCYLDNVEEFNRVLVGELSA